MDPREILDNARKAISDCAGNDPDKWFYANRFVFARLQLDERRTKTQVKKDLLAGGKPCHYCQEAIDGKVGVHLHRMDGDRGYTADNCVLMHRECHTRYHSENPRGVRSRVAAVREQGEFVPLILEKVSKRYEGKSFIYWWDISPGFLDKLDHYESLEFVKKDTGQKCRVPTPALKGYLTKERQTTRGQGNWGIKVLEDRENELAFEPHSKNDDWLFLPVVWRSQ